MPSRLPGFFDDDAEEDLEDTVDAEEENDAEQVDHPDSKEDTLEIELVEDPNASKWRGDPAKALEKDENDKDFGKRVQKRINKVTAAAGELDRQLRAERQAKAEILAVAQARTARVEELERQLAEKNAQRYASEAKGAETEASLALNDLKQATVVGDAGAMGDASARMADAKARQLQHKRDAESETARAEAAKAKVTQATQAAQQAQDLAKQEAAPVIPARTVQWFKDNPWFKADGSDAKSAFAIAKHRELLEDGVVEGSERYFKELNKELHTKYPKFFGVEGKAERRSGTVRTERTPKEKDDQQDNPIKGNTIKFTKSQLERAASLKFCTPQEVATREFSKDSRAKLRRYALEISNIGDKD